LSRLDAGERRLDLCFYLDGCDDGSEAVLRAAARKGAFPVHVEIGVRSAEANAGRARGAAMTVGMNVLNGSDGMLFTTDADSRPAADWIAAGAVALALADVVAGRIVRHDRLADRHQSRVERYYDRLHACRCRIDPVGWEAADTHHFGGGANMAMRASTYRALGGFQPLPHGEDARLLDDAARAGWRVRRDAALVVETSSRRDGRAVHGLAGALRSLDEGKMPVVAHPFAVAWQAEAQARARHAFATIGRAETRAMLGAAIGLSADHVLGVARDCPNAQAFAMRIVPAAPVYREQVTLGDAEAALAELEAMACEVAA
jgi:hypothetical protein